MHRIAVLSDTHNLLRPEVLACLKECEIILHAGDISREKILEQLRQIAPTYAVRGNNDREFGEKLPETLCVTLFGIRFFMVHNKKQIPADVSDFDIVIYGHSHKYEQHSENGTLFLNPGSCGPRRFTQPVTMAVLEIAQDASYRVIKTELPHEAGNRGSADVKREKDLSETELPQNIKQIIGLLIKDINRGRGVEEMAQKYGISAALAEQICRLYVTHPGVDADGIMTKMGL